MGTNHLKKVATLVMTGILAFSLTACGGSNNSSSENHQHSSASDSGTDKKNPELKKITVGYIMVMDDAPAILANDAKLYEKHGIQADLKMFSSGTDLIKAIVGGQVDVGVLGFTNALSWLEKGADLKVIGGAQMGYHSMIVRKDSDIKDIKDLKGKTVASQKQGTTADIVLNGVTLAKDGLTREDLNMVYVEPSVAIQSLGAGKVDAAFVFEPYDSIAQATMGAKSIYQVGKEWPFPCMVTITSGDFLKKDKDAAFEALDAQKEAIEMLQKEPEKAAGFITKRFIEEDSLAIPDGSKVKATDIITKAIKNQQYNYEITDDQIKRMQEISDIMLKQGILKQQIDVNKSLDLSWQKAAK
ncbi:MAG TPA: ABC transporter substrate-binding protein [Bacillota bacterium]|nr:ABC transporter substrate-binding protein [Bacillota bacterium]